MKTSNLGDAPVIHPVKGVDMALIGIGDRMTLTRMTIQPGSLFPEHSHPNEQIGTCIEGEGELRSGGKILKVRAGESWVIPENERHSFLSQGEKPVIIIEAWSPPREDYMAMARKK